VIRAQGAGEGELEALYRRRLDVFARVATTITGSSERGRDAVQEGFAIALLKRRSFRREGPLEAWMWRIVLNAARAERRRTARFREPGLPASQDGSERDGDVRAALARLPERQRTAVFLRYYADLDYDAIADVLGMRPGTVASTLNAARTALRRSLEEVDA
jgi:RNA polymerase sigma-70 factor (ECF subfamily)